jgi:hypothetical protein
MERQTIPARDRIPIPVECAVAEDPIKAVETDSAISCRRPNPNDTRQCQYGPAGNYHEDYLSSLQANRKAVAAK